MMFHEEDREEEEEGAHTPLLSAHPHPHSHPHSQARLHTGSHSQMRSRGVTEGAAAGGAGGGGGGGSRKVPRRERASTPDSLRVVWQKFTSEFIGTFVFLLLGLCATTSSVITGAQSGIWQGAVVWGIAVSLAIYATSDVSGAHINPAVSLAMAVMKPDTEFSWFQCAYYIIAQVLGSIAAAAVNYAMWSNFIHDYESKNNIDRGSPGSEVSAMVFCDYFPNASLYPPQESEHLMSPLGAVVIETLATALLLFFIFAVSDPHNKAALPAPGPILIGGAVAIIISTIGPLTQAGLNPARDFGPRVVAWLAGWDSIAFPGPQNGFWVYIVGPFAGGPLGALLYTHVLHARREDNHRTSRVSLDASDRRFDFLDNK